MMSGILALRDDSEEAGECSPFKHESPHPPSGILVKNAARAVFVHLNRFSEHDPGARTNAR